MTLQQLEYIVALDTYRHFVTAADKCFVTQPTLTMQVKKLEDEIGIIIFNRKKHPLEPTRAGEKVIIKARQILREVSQFREMVSDDHESMAGLFQLAVIPTVAPYLIPLFIGDFISKYQDTRLQINEVETIRIIDELKNEKIDLAILSTPLKDDELREIPLYKEPFLVYAAKGHPLHGKNQIEKDDIDKAENLWLLNQEHCFRNQVLNVCQKNKTGFDSLSYESGSIETLKNLVKSNYGFTLVPELAIDKDDAHAILFKEMQPVREISIVVHKSFTKELLIEKLREEILKKLPDSITKVNRYIKVRWR